MIRTSVLRKHPSMVEEEASMESRMRKHFLETNTAANSLCRDENSSPIDAVAASNDSTPILEHFEEDTRQTDVRQEMISRIEQRLDPNAPSRPALAQALEKYLYNNASSFEVYADVSTLNCRLRLVIVALLSRRRLKKNKQNGRRDALKKALGPQKYQQVCDLVKQVQELRLQGAATCKCTTICEPKINIPGQRAMPTPVRALFFHTEIVEAATNTPLDRVPHLPWDGMIQQARDNIHAFQDWSRLNRRDSQQV